MTFITGVNLTAFGLMALAFCTLEIENDLCCMRRFTMQVSIRIVSQQPGGPGTAGVISTEGNIMVQVR